MNKNKKVSRSFWKTTPFAIIAICCCISITTVALAATNFIPQERTQGSPASTISPVISGQGSGAQVVVPEVIPDSEEQKPPFDPFIPDLKDDEPFIDMENPRDYSTQYDYTNAVMQSKHGSFTENSGVYTAASANSMSVNLDASTPFPYGTMSADVVSNGGDSGLVFAVSARANSFWEGNGISYYFLFISGSGNIYLGRTHNGTWSTLCYKAISGYSTTATYNVKVVYRVEKIVIFLDGEAVLSYRAGEPLTGTGWGIRAGAEGSTISNLVVSSKVAMD